MIRAELFAAAKAALEARRQAAAVEAQGRREAIYAALPALVLLDEQKAQAGILAATLAMDGKKEQAEKALALVREVSVRQAKMLAQAGFSPEDLQPRPHCKKCGDRGYADGEMCSCLQDEIKRLRREKIHADGPLRLCRFDTFLLEKYPEQMEDMQGSPRQAMQRVLQECQDYARGFGLASRNLFLFGDAGLGKTHLALSVAAEVLEKGFDVIYVSAQAAFSRIGSARYGDDEGLFDSMLRADLLVLDDLGTEYIDAYILSKLYELVNDRLGRRPTIYTSNICTQDVLHQRYTEKITSRLLGECQHLRLWGNDIRLQV